ncbi:MAG: NADH:ubiquinone reductase (Na(+)-transporting) subunit C [Saprospirales bacterium]|nr:NADH:ubiquinone reductase (Na(+)-transporting) subunit C [Saprospirales bacterium]MBK6903205.1 NADH:ubiquinone reductase (Na(+)-transporting) subunit C [Saprospirales bacterium]MBK7334756.1 NADH:ubiquinone reductase (Na(+)-transporting) subunit C [Saprospirales bacterium]
MESNSYVLKFTLVMTVIAALILSGMFYATKPTADKNEAVFTKRAILSAVESQLGKDLASLSDDEVLQVFDQQMEQVTLNMKGEAVEGIQAEKVDMAKEKKKPEAERVLPLFIYKGQDGKKYYILSVRGSGLWDEIWGNIALAEDLNTVVGASFDHKGETPGLGGEIKDNPGWKAQFKDKHLFDASGKFTSINVRKGGAVDKEREVDSISGATITSVGVSEMLLRGIGYYLPYFEKLRAQGGATGMQTESE